MSLTPEFKTRFYFPLQRMDQILDGSYPRNAGWVAKWRAFLLRFHKLRIEQIRGMLYVCAKRRLLPPDLWRRLRTVHWTSKLYEAESADLASVLHSLALVSRSRQFKDRALVEEPFAKGVIKQAAQRPDLNSFSTISLSQCLYAFAVLNLSGHHVVTLYSAEISQPHRASGMTPQSVANTLWSWAKLQYKESAHLESLSETAVQKRRAANEQELTNILWAWGLLGQRSEKLWNLMMDEIATRRTRLTGQGLSLVFVTCARAAHRDTGHCSALLQHATETKKHILFSHHVMAHLIWSFGKLKLSPDDSGIMTCIKEALKTSRLEQYTAQELCCLAIGLSLMAYQNLDHGIALQREVMKSHRTKVYNSQELCSFVWALGKMPIPTLECQRSLAAELVQRKDVLTAIPCRGLSSVILGWAHCRFPDKAESNVVFREAMKEARLRTYNPQELANLCWSFGRLDIHSPNLHARLAQHILKPDTLSRFTPQALSIILVGWAHGNFLHAAATAAVGRALEGPKLRGLKSQELANVCWALGKLRCVESAVVKPIAVEAAHAHRLKAFTPLQLSTVLLGWSKSAMHDFHLWDRLLAEFAARPETLVVDLPILHHFNIAVQSVGFESVNAYRTAREKGRFP